MRKRDLQLALAAIKLSRLPGVGARLFQNLVEAAKSPCEALENYLVQLPDHMSSLPEFSQKKASTERGIERAEDFLKTGGKATYRGHADYPVLLAEIPEPPPVLFIRGKIPQMPMIAVVGSRKADADGEKAAKIISGKLIEEGFCIISGGAHGIDTFAHKLSLAMNKPTVAVFGCGVDIPYPKANKSMFDKITARGALLSELLPGTPPQRSFFPTRNRIVAGLAKAVVIIQASSRSGALITARFARKFNRPVFAVVPTSASEAWDGNRFLIANSLAKPLSMDESFTFLRDS